MSWHHIIPFSLLREVWNRLVDRHLATDWPEARVAIRQYLLLSDRNQPRLDEYISRMRANEPGHKRAGNNPLLALDVPEVNELATLAVWPAWNAVEGPKNRTDDPKDRYFDRFTFGLTAEEAARMQAIEKLFEQLRMFAGELEPGPESLRRLADTASIFRPHLLCDLPIPFRAEMWVQEKDGTWHKRRE